jgi:hypothetical protein
MLCFVEHLRRMSVGPPNSIDRQDRHHGQGCETDRHCKLHCRRHKRKSVARRLILAALKKYPAASEICASDAR